MLSAAIGHPIFASEANFETAANFEKIPTGNGTRAKEGCPDAELGTMARKFLADRDDSGVFGEMGA